ncbi:MAG: 1,4-beta-xylanase, partial [Verrucomicrobia bacterium]
MALILVCLATTLGAVTFSNQLSTPATGADPFVLKHEGIYYLYCTAENHLTDTGIPVYTSTNLIDWIGPCGAGEHGLALHEDDVWGDTWFWGGDVIEKDGKFYMYATVEEHLVAAVSDSPLGPFTQAVKEPMHWTKEIDASVFTDDDGKHYIYYVRFEGGNVEYVAELSDDMLSMKEETITFCLRALDGTWERGPNEP